MRESLFCGRYRVVRRLGTGGTATVYLAQDDRLDRLVAVKRLHGAEVTEETAERLRREARIMASLRHPNLVTVLDMLTEDDDLFLIMEFVDGRTLAELLREEAPLPPRDVLALLRPVADALDHAHERGVVHRDVKPSNVLVGRDGTVKLADMGLATAAEITRITPPGSIVGTPAYMAPEQAQPVPCTGAVDVYALASIAFEALSGTPPRTGRTALAVLREATTRPPPDVRERRPETPARAAYALIHAMSADPEARQATAGQLVDELAEAFAAAPAATAPTRASSSSSDEVTVSPENRDLASETPRGARPAADARLRRLIVPLAVAAAVAVAVAVVLVARGGGGGDPQQRAAATPTRAQASATPTRTATPTPTATRTPTATPEPAGSPATAAVRSFYQRAAAKDYAGAWRLAGPTMRAQFGDSEPEFAHQLSTLERVRFDELAVEQQSGGSATIRLRTTATHTDHVDHCSGTLRAVRSGGRWLVEPSGLSCERD